MKGRRERRRDFNQVAREAPFLKVDGVMLINYISQG